MNIEIKQIYKSYGKREVLRNLSFSARGGECVGILGENGSGKSTLFGVATGLLSGGGEFLLDGVNLLSDKRLRAKRVGFVPQSPPLLSELNARDNLRLWYQKEDMRRSLEWGFLKMLGINDFLSVPVYKMSGGMQKRLAIGCAISHNPDILFLDEPGTALDLPCKERIYAYLGEFCARGGIAVIATHDIYELKMCDSLYILNSGSLSLYSGERSIKCLVGQIENG